ncbi:ER lumen protein-retaining receptor 1 [Durusdinium trenchii]
MAGDRCLPEFFSETNTWRNTPHYTILVFFGVCSSMCIMLDGDITLLAAIYSISFLLVMGLFAFCGLWLKINRPTLPREIKSHPAFFVCGLLLVSCAFTAVVLLHPEMLTYFYIYYGITTTMVMLTFARVSIFKSFLQLMSHSKVARFIIQWFVHKRVAEEWAHQKLKNLQDQGVVYFTKRASMSQINRALQYIEQNEEARWVKVIHCYTDLDQIPPNLEEYVRILDCVYPTLKVDSILVRGEFSPAMVQYISKRIQVKVNCMFINCPKIDFKHPLDRMGGVRVILNSEKPNPFKRLAGTTSPFFGLSPTSPMRGNDYMALVQDKLSEDEKDMQSSPDYSFNLDLDRGN